MHLQPQRRKNRWRPANPFVQLDDAVALSPALAIKEGKKGGLGGSYPYISAAPRSTDRLPHCAPRPLPSSGGINQDNSLHALNSEPATIHTNIRQDKKGEVEKGER